MDKTLKQAWEQALQQQQARTQAWEQLHPQQRRTLSGDPYDVVRKDEMTQPDPLDKVFMRHCPGCGSEVFYDRDRDVTVSIEPEAGMLKIRFKDGKVREVKVAEAALIP